MISQSTRSVALAWCLALSSPITAAAPSVLDINSEGQTSAGFRRIENSPALLQDRWLIFAADDGVFGSEPWVHDLESGLTQRLADIAPGAGSSRPRDFVALASTVVFTAEDAEAGRELWASDGTPEGTRRIADIRPGPSASGIDRLTAVRPNRAVFAASDGVHGTEPWTTDGTPEGTMMLADISPGSGSSSPRDFVWLDTRLLFVASEPVHGTELWRWSPASSAVELVRDIRPGSASGAPAHLTRIDTDTPLGSFIVFSACPDIPCQAWRSNGSEAGTQELFTIPDGGSPSNFAWHPGLNRLFFSASDSVHGTELWQFQPGPGQVPQLLADIRPGADSSEPSGLTIWGSELALIAKGGIDNLWRLYRYDGTDLVSGGLITSSGTSVGSPLVWDDQLFVRGGSACYRWAPEDEAPSSFQCQTTAAEPLAAAQGVLFVAGPNLALEWFLIDADGEIAQASDFRNFSSSPSGFSWLGDEVFFAASDGINGLELWIADSGLTNARGIDLRPGPADSLPGRFVSHQGRMWFAARDDSGRTKLWFSDGTAAGTDRFDPDEQFIQSLRFTAPLSIGSALFVAADDAQSESQLLRVDGIDQPPLPIRLVDEALTVNAMQRGDDRLFLLAYTDSTGVELFVANLDGSNLRALEIIAGPDDASPRTENLAVWQNEAYFIARDANQRFQLWRSDEPSPVQVTGADGGRVASEQSITGPGGIYFVYQSATDACQLGRADRQDLVLFDMADLRDGPCPEFERGQEDAAATDDRFYFVADSDTLGTELWVSDGETPPRPIDVRPGSGSSTPRSLSALGHRLLFSATDGQRGRELYVAEAGRATRLADIWPGAAGSDPSSIAIDPSGRIALFSALDPQFWREPHRLDLERALRVFSDRFEADSAKTERHAAPTGR